MKENDVHKLIEEQDKEKKAFMFEKFQKQHGLKSGKQAVKHKIRIFVASIVAVATAVLIIAIPLMINEISSNHKRYFTVDDCISIKSASTVKDYAIGAKKDFLYVDWYDKAEEVQTMLYVNKENEEDIVYIQETIVNAETGETVDLYILDKSTTMEFFTNYEETCNRKIVIKSTLVKWYYGHQKSVAFFTNNGYKYFIVYQDPIEEDSVLKIIEDMV